MKKMHLVSHVHWDPAWYLPYEQYRLTLIPLMKMLLTILEEDKDYHSFFFDGQIDALDEYLVICPEDRERVRTLVKAGRLIVGPWYIQPEEFLLSGETHIRNMLIGKKKTEEYGADPIPVTYLCDMVGHIAQMPQLIRGFGMEYFVGWRGILNGKDRGSTAQFWEGPDGSRVVLKDLTGGYYHPFDGTNEQFEAKIAKMMEGEAPFDAGEPMLILQGADHRMPLANTPQLIREYNRARGADVIEHTTLLRHLESIDRTNLPTVRGEMRAAWKTGTYILTGILTARMDLKFRSEQITREMERWAEPFSAMASIFTGAEYPRNALHYAWVRQLRCAFHDNIYSAHVDAVTDDILSDYKKAFEITEWTTRESLHTLTKGIRTTGESDNITVFNPSHIDRHNCTVIVDYSVQEGRAGSEFAVFTSAGEYLPCQLLSLTKGVKDYAGLSGNQWAHAGHKLCNRYRLAVTLPHLPGLGYVNLGIRRHTSAGAGSSEYVPVRRATEGKTDLRRIGHTAENRHLRLSVGADGMISVYDKRNGTLYTDILQIEESGDKGDLYNYSVPYGDRIYYDRGAPAEIRIEESGDCRVSFSVRRRWMLPVSATRDGGRAEQTVENTVTTTVTLEADSPILLCKTVIDNRARDHRYRLFLPTGIEGKSVRSGSQFYINTRRREEPLPDSYIEEPMNNQPQRLFTDLSDDRRGIAVLSRGLSEYDARENGNLYLTLLRCVGYLSTDTNRERSYAGAGPEFATPRAEEIGEHTAEYALYFHSGEKDADTVAQVCDTFYATPRSMQGVHTEGKLPPEGCFIRLRGEGLLLSALKQAESGEGWIIRFSNTLNRPVSGTLSCMETVCAAYKTDLSEKREETLAVVDNQIRFTLRPYEIYTVEFHVKGECV